jgi:hypothetical protein
VAATVPPIVEAFQVIVAVVPDALAAGLAGALKVVTLPLALPDPVVVKYARAPLTSAIATSMLVATRFGRRWNGSLMGSSPPRYRTGSRSRPGSRLG